MWKADDDFILSTNTMMRRRRRCMDVVERDILALGF
jgi:hypothetical protein